MKFDSLETKQLYTDIKNRNNVDFVLYDDKIFTSLDLLSFEECFKKDIKIIKERNDSIGKGYV